MTSSLSLLFFFSLIYYLPSFAGAAHPDIILKTCKQCSYSSPNVNYTLCVATLTSVHKSYQSDIRHLGIISVELTIAKAKQTRSMVKKLLEAEAKPKPKNHFVRSCLNTCVDLYTAAIYNLKCSVKAIKSGQFAEANIRISSSVDAPGGCNRNFEEGNVNCPLVEEDKAFFQLAVISLSIAAILQ